MAPQIQVLANRMVVDGWDLRVQHTDTMDGVIVKSIRYVRVSTNVIPDCWLESEADFQLPELPSGNWDFIDIIRDKTTGSLVAYKPRRIEILEIKPWHSRSVDYFDLEKVFQVPYHPGFRNLSTDNYWVVKHHSFLSLALMKISEFPYLTLNLVQRETATYEAIDGKGVAPKFLAHVTEGGRITGFLMEYVGDGRRPEVGKDDQACNEALEKLHNVGWLHRDVHSGNFIVKPDGTVTLIDFEAATPCNIACLFDRELEEREGRFRIFK